MPKVYLDRLRSSVPKVTMQERVWGFDPDLRHVGWGVVVLERQGPRVSPRAWDAGLITADQLKLTGLDQVEAMVRSICVWRPPVLAGERDRLVVEAQEYYSGSRIDANDLLRLAQVTGALQAHVTREIAAPHTALPKAWKGQKGKPGMHARLVEWLAPVTGPRPIDELRAECARDAEHFLDALCMCRWLASTPQAGATP